MKSTLAATKRPRPEGKRFRVFVLSSSSPSASSLPPLLLPLPCSSPPVSLSSAERRAARGPRQRRRRRIIISRPLRLPTSNPWYAVFATPSKCPSISWQCWHHDEPKSTRVGSLAEEAVRDNAWRSSPSVRAPIRVGPGLGGGEFGWRGGGQSRRSEGGRRGAVTMMVLTMPSASLLSLCLTLFSLSVSSRGEKQISSLLDGDGGGLRRCLETRKTSERFGTGN